MAENKKQNTLLHKRSVKKGVLPQGEILQYGEIAVNYNSEEPFLSIRKDGENKEYAKFSADEVIAKMFDEKYVTIEDLEDNEEVIASALTELNDRLDEVENKPLLIEITYLNLKSLRDNSQLVPGQQYRITDYMTTTVQENTRIAEEYHPFDIIVVADDVNVLNENARAIQHEGDTYFSNSDLNAWELKYCIDNDTSRFAWADATNGKGVIYYMKDEWNNECPYDFKNIQFKRFVVTECDKTPSLVVDNEENYYGYYYGALTLFGGTVIPEATYGEDFVWVHTFALKDLATGTWHDYTILNSIGLKTDESLVITCHSNVIKEHRDERLGEHGRKAIWLNNIVFFNCYDDISSSNYSDYYSYCYSNTFSDGCYSNTFGNDCFSNSFGDYCFYNSFGNYCFYNSFGNRCTNNTFGNRCTNNTFGNDCYSNSFGNGCFYNSFGNGCYYNSFGNDCYYNSFGNDCYSNSFGNDCNNNSFGNSCGFNSFGNYCKYNSFGNYCKYNSFGNGCYYNSFGNSCDSNSFRLSQDLTDNKASGDKMEYVRNVHYGDGCTNIVLYVNPDNVGTINGTNSIRNINVAQGLVSKINGGYPTFVELTTTAQDYEIKVARNSAGDIKVFCLADLIA